MKNKKRIAVLVMTCITILILILDLITKHFSAEVNYEFIPGFIRFFYTQNTGAAWSIFSESLAMLIIISVIAVSSIIIYVTLSKEQSMLFHISLALILGGAVGNMFDRIVFGYVRDFIMFEFIDFPVFNIADAALTVGVVLFCIYFIISLIKGRKKNEK